MHREISGRIAGDIEGQNRAPDFRERILGIADG
jgi:hypothetical protein